MTFDVQKATEEWLASFEKYGLELKSGKFSYESFLKWLESCPAEVQSNPANKFEPRRRELIQALKEMLSLDVQLSRKPSSPQDSQVQAIAELITKNIDINGSTGGKYVAAGLPLRRAVANIQPIDSKLLEQFDAHFFAMLKFTEHRREFPLGFEGRLRLAAQKNDIPFFVKLGECLSKPAEFSLDTDVQDFQLSATGTFLLKNWENIQGWEPNYGLNQFSRKTLLAYCEARLDPHEKKERSITGYAVEKERSRLKLKRSLPPLVKDARLGKDRRGNPDTQLIILQLNKGGQIIHKRVSTLRNQS